MSVNESEGYPGNSCGPYVAQDRVQATLWYQVIVYLLYSVIFVVAIFGNGLVCYVVKSNPRMKTVMNFFFVNLALSDILLTLFCVPTTFVSTVLLQHWPFGPALCPVVNYFQAVTVLVSAYTLVAISIDRYIAIMWPLKPRISKRQAKQLILFVWVIGLLISLPIAIYSKHHQPAKRYKDCDRYICNEVWPLKEDRYHYTMLLLVLQYLIPLSVLLFTYTSIGIIVWGKTPPGEAENARDQRMARSKRKMVKMMITVVLIFSLCWLPFNILNLVLDSYETLESWVGLPYVWMALHWLAMSHSCYNPVIYCWMHARFRAGFMSVFGRLPVIRRIMPNAGQNNNNTSMVGIPLTGFDGSTHSVLRRMNTCTTYVSVRRKTNNGGHGPAVRSASLRNSESLRTSGHGQHRVASQEAHLEEQI